ncbi:uncharacterized protein VNE69_10005 [Vairimorpha necatrix]|uniref:Uncharacterized protein n=1 Tax=Vairimorpha necatrix TaxID=6039 RepID=A0AAX4JF79_9MICR
MRNQLNTQIDALKASNERLEQRIDMILTAKKGEKDAIFIFCVVRRSRKKEISEAMDILGLEILKEIPTRDRVENKRSCN